MKKHLLAAAALLCTVAAMPQTTPAHLPRTGGGRHDGDGDDGDYKK